MRPDLRPSVLALLALVPALAFAAPQAAEDEEGKGAAEALVKMGFKPGPFVGEVGSTAELKVGDEQLFVGQEGAGKFMEFSGNLTSGNERGVLLAKDFWVLFSYRDIGYVKDDDKDDLDADEMLDSIREGTAAANEEYRKRGSPTLEITGWQTPPHYDEASHRLEWAPKAKASDGDEVVNYNTRVLGRSGVMEVSLITDPVKLDAAMPHFRSILAAFSFKSGQDYASYRQGDRVAAVGLAALVTGGAVGIAAKTGLLKKLWKLIVVGVLGLGAGIKKLLGFRSARTAESEGFTEKPPAV